METERIVPQFQEPMVTFTKKGECLGICYGAKAFNNGWYAIAREDSLVTLYNSAGVVVENELNDCYAFASGKYLVQREDGGVWQLKTGKRLLHPHLKNVRITEDEYWIAYVDNRASEEGWYLFSPECLSLNAHQPFADIQYCRLKYLRARVVVKNSTDRYDIYRLGFAWGHAVKMELVLANLPNCTFIADKCFAVCKEGETLAESRFINGVPPFRLYKANGDLFRSGIVGCIVFVNGMMLVNDGWKWDLFDSKFGLLREDVRQAAFMANLTEGRGFYIDANGKLTNSGPLDACMTVYELMPDIGNLLSETVLIFDANAQSEKLLNFIQPDGTTVMENCSVGAIKIL